MTPPPEGGGGDPVAAFLADVWNGVNGILASTEVLIELIPELVAGAQDIVNQGLAAVGIPDADKAGLESLAQLWEASARAVDGARANAMADARAVEVAWPDSGGGSLQYAIEQFASAKPGAMGEMQAAMSDLAAKIRTYSAEMEYLRDQMKWELLIAVADWAFTIATIGNPGAFALRSLIKHAIINRLTTGLARKIAETTARISGLIPQRMAAKLTVPVLKPALESATGKVVDTVADMSVEAGQEIVSYVGANAENNVPITADGLKKAALSGGAGELVSKAAPTGRMSRTARSSTSNSPVSRLMPTATTRRTATRRTTRPGRPRPTAQRKAKPRRPTRATARTAPQTPMRRTRRQGRARRTPRARRTVRTRQPAPRRTRTTRRLPVPRPTPAGSRPTATVAMSA